MLLLMHVTAATLNAVLAFTNPNNTPKIAYDKDELAIPLINKLKDTVGERDGSQSVSLAFYDNEEELLQQFKGICGNIKMIFENIEENCD